MTYNRHKDNVGLNGEVFTGEKKYQVSAPDREAARLRSIDSAKRKQDAESNSKINPTLVTHVPRLDPASLMVKMSPNKLRALSLFSGGGGLDLGYERAGFAHVASYDYNSDAGTTLRQNRPKWRVHSGSDGNVVGKDWSSFQGKVDVIHGGPPCQPFSSAGLQKGADDVRDMFPQFVRATLTIRPKAFMAENVPALLQKKFQGYVKDTIVSPLSELYNVWQISLHAHQFGIPQYRKRIFFIGFRKDLGVTHYGSPTPTHYLVSDELTLPGINHNLKACPTLRWALGLEDIGCDDLAPTIRSTLTGPRHTTSILSSTAAMAKWAALRIWPNGVGRDRQAALNFPAKNGHYRLSVPDVQIIQGFPEEWTFSGPAYMALGLIGNAVPPPLAYNVAKSIAQVLQK